MTTNYNGAYDLVRTEFMSYWRANAGAIVGGDPPEVRFYGVEEARIPETSFVRFIMQPVTDTQSSFRQTDGQRFAAEGLIYIQLFVLRTDPQAYEHCRGLAVLAQKRLRRAVDCVWFKNVRINDAPAEHKFLRQNVIAEYRYDEIQAG